jgi:hypothetical protein
MDKVRCTRLTNIEDTPKNASELHAMDHRKTGKVY